MTTTLRLMSRLEHDRAVAEPGARADADRMVPAELLTDRAVRVLVAVPESETKTSWPNQTSSPILTDLRQIVTARAEHAPVADDQGPLGDARAAGPPAASVACLSDHRDTRAEVIERVPTRSRSGSRCRCRRRSCRRRSAARVPVTISPARSSQRQPVSTPALSSA